MPLWRISNHATLDGAGGLRASARWHTRGRPIVYCAAEPAGALLEMLVHLELEPEDLPRRYRLLRIEGADGLARARIDPASLPGNWRGAAAATRAVGDAWLRAERTALLEVPSAIVPQTWNVLVNPRHADAQGLHIAAEFEDVLDRRLHPPPSAAVLPER